MKSLWAKITRKSDESGVYPIQQSTSLGRISDVFVLFPFGMHANVPVDQLGLLIDRQGKIFMGTSAVGRIVVEEGEVVFYHPKSKSKIHFRDSGDVDVETQTDVNINANNVNIDAAVTNLGVGGAAIARAGDVVEVTVVGGSSAGTHSGTITAGGVNTSI